MEFVGAGKVEGVVVDHRGGAGGQGGEFRYWFSSTEDDEWYTLDDRETDPDITGTFNLLTRQYRV